MSPVTDYVRQRNQEIGAILAQARQQQQRTVTECAAILATSRRRYRAIERGEVGVAVAELELLLHYLDIPPQAIWQQHGGTAVPRVIHLHPGEMVQLLITADANTTARP